VKGKYSAYQKSLCVLIKLIPLLERSRYEMRYKAEEGNRNAEMGSWLELRVVTEKNVLFRCYEVRLL
jgi:hypothetical protein